MKNQHHEDPPAWPRVLLLAAAFWIGLGLLSSTSSWVQQNPGDEMEWRPFHSLWPVLHFFPHIPATLWLWFLGRRLAHDGWSRCWPRVVLAVAVLGLWLAGWQGAIYDMRDPVALSFTAIWSMLHAAAILAVATAYSGIDLARRRQHELVEAQLRALRGQLQPHALFNTLQAIGSTAERDGPLAARMIVLLGDMLRHGLERKDGALVALADELAMLDPYLQLQQLRFADRLSIELDVPDDVRHAAVPDLLLQPLVENALLHGIERRPGAGSIQIRAHRDGAHLDLEVADDGVASAPDEADYGTGLANTATRLRTLFGAGGSLQLQRNGRGGTTARVRIPFREVGDAA